MSKPAIGYAIVPQRWSPERCSILTITLVLRHQVYGRNDAGEATHRRASDILAQFDTEQEAVDALHRIERARSLTQPAINTAIADLEIARRRQREAIAAAAKGDPS